MEAIVKQRWVITPHLLNKGGLLLLDGREK